jgi:hypothetical protein
MTELEKKLIEHLDSLTESARMFWEGDETGCIMAIEDYFETELVRAEDFLEEVKRNAQPHNRDF